MKTYRKSLFVLAFSILFFACESDDNKTVSENGGFGFMKNGNTWTYDYMMEEATTSFDLTYKIIEQADEGYYIIEMQTPFGDAQDLYWYASNGVFAEESGAFPPNYVFQLVKSGANVGDKWNAAEEDEELGVISREVISLSEQVNVPAGNFSNCIMVKETFSNDNQIVNYYWVSKDYGIVKKQATGWADMDENPRIYFGIDIQLKSFNF